MNVNLPTRSPAGTSTPTGTLSTPALLLARVTNRLLSGPAGTGPVSSTAACPSMPPVVPGLLPTSWKFVITASSVGAGGRRPGPGRRGGRGDVGDLVALRGGRQLGRVPIEVGLDGLPHLEVAALGGVGDRELEGPAGRPLAGLDQPRLGAGLDDRAAGGPGGPR